MKRGIVYRLTAREVAALNKGIEGYRDSIEGDVRNVAERISQSLSVCGPLGSPEEGTVYLRVSADGSVVGNKWANTDAH